MSEKSIVRVNLPPSRHHLECFPYRCHPRVAVAHETSFSAVESESMTVRRHDAANTLQNAERPAINWPEDHNEVGSRAARVRAVHLVQRFDQAVRSIKHWQAEANDAGRAQSW